MTKKIEVIEEVLKHIENALSDVDKALVGRMEAAREAETRNQSRYDTKGWEAAREAEGVFKIHEVLEQQKKYFHQALQKTRVHNNAENPKNVSVGSMVRLQKESGDSQWFYFVGCPGGIEIQEVIVVSATAPIAQRVLGLPIGTKVCLPDGRYAVSEIL